MANNLKFWSYIEGENMIFKNWLDTRPKMETHDHTLYLSFFLHGQNFGLNFSPHKKCANRDKTGFATKQRKFQ